MKWPRKIFFVLWLALIGWLVIWLYPFVQPLVQHPSTHGWLTLVVNNLLNTKQNQNILYGPMTWVLVGIIGLMVLMMEIETRTRRTTTYGSAHAASGREIRPFVHAPERFPHLPRVRHASPAVQRPQEPPPPPESCLILGTYHGRVISLTEQQQESNVLLTAPIGAGKTARVIIPNLLQEQGSRSLFI